MTIFNIAKLPFAEYKGVEFHYQDSSIDGGRKTVTHEYPGMTNRFVEDLGGLEKIFTITAWTDDNVSDVTRDGLINVLESEGIGTLTHPRFGDLNVVPVGYNLVDNINQLGISKFNITFEIATLNILPSADKGNKGFLSRLKNKVLGDNVITFDNAWSSVKNVKSKFDSAVATTKKAAREMKRVSELVKGSGDTFSDFATSINQIIGSANSLVQSPSDLSSSLRTSFDNLSVAYDNSQDLFNVVKNMFGFDESDRESDGNSALQKAIAVNQDQINNFFSSSSLALAYNAAANIDYKTLEELNLVVDDLEAGFEALPDNLDRDVFDSLVEMRIESSDIFANLAIGLPNINDLEVINATSLNTLVYSLYGSLEQKETIRDLNEFRDTSRVSGTIKILSNV